MNFARALIVCRNSSANLACSWSCQVSPSAANLACNSVILFWRSWLKRFSSSAKRRTSAGSMTAFDIALSSLRVNTLRPAGDSSWQAYKQDQGQPAARWPEPATRYQRGLVRSKGKQGMKYVGRIWNTATISEPGTISLSPRRRSGVRERGNPMTNSSVQPLSPSLSPLVPRGERESSRAMVVVSRRCARYEGRNQAPIEKGDIQI